MSPTSQQWGSYARIAEALRERFRGLPPGSPVPSEAALSAEFGVARNTVRRALGEVAGEGLIGTVPGRGRVVRSPGPAPDQVPAYRRIAADLEQAITSGDLTAGDPLPSEASLTRRYGVSRGTARQALSVLETLGLVASRQGKGRFVRATRPGDGRPGSPS